MTTGIGPSARVQALLRSVGAIRQRDAMVDDEQLELLLMDQDLEPSEALVDFERQLGGWIGSWMALGIAAMAPRSGARWPGHVLVGRRGPDPIFMNPVGHVVLIDEGRPRLEAASMRVWLEREALCLPLRKKENALAVHAWGADVPAMVAMLKATRDDASSDDAATTWVIPKGRGLLVAYAHGELVAMFPSVRAASRGFVDATVSVRLRPVRAKLERAAMPGPTPPLSASFVPSQRGGLVRRVAKTVVGEDPVLQQWTYRDDVLRSHAFLRDGGSKIRVYVDATSLPVPLTTVDASRDPALCLPREGLDALLFARGLPSLDAVVDFERNYGGIGFWTDVHPVQLGPAHLLLTDPALGPEDLRGADGRVPIAQALSRLWAMGVDGSIVLVRDDGDPGPEPASQRFEDARAFLVWLAGQATKWRGFPYPVEA